MPCSDLLRITILIMPNLKLGRQCLMFLFNLLVSSQYIYRIIYESNENYTSNRWKYRSLYALALRCINIT